MHPNEVDTAKMDEDPDAFADLFPMKLETVPGEGKAYLDAYAKQRARQKLEKEGK